MSRRFILSGICFILMLALPRAETSCPGWTPVPTDWNATVKEYCARYGQECKAVSMMYEPPNNEMSLDPLYGSYEDLILNHPDAVTKTTGGMQAREIKCEEFILTPEMSAAKAADEKLRRACEDKKGIWGRQDGRGRVHGCNLPTSDAGKSCSDSSECESACVSEKISGTMHSYGWKQFKGCGKMVSGQVICVD